MSETNPKTGPDTEAEQAIRFIERLKNPENTEHAGRPIRLLEWEKSYLRRLYDTQDARGNRQYEKSLLFLPKKQGKTTFVAAMALERMVRRKHRQVKCLAIVKEQASILYKFVASMIRQNESLSDRRVCRVYKGNMKIIECHASDSQLQVLSSDAIGANGLNGSDVFYDECCFAETSELWDAVISGGINREEFLAVGLSTAGINTSSWGYSFYEQAKAILAKPELDPTFLPVIYEAPADADWTDPKVYLQCSPTFREMGDAAIRRIAGMIEAAKKDPTQLRRLMRYHLNQWVGADAKTPWVAIDKWDASTFELDPATLEGRVCYAGIDLAAVSDMTAVALWFPLEDNRFALLMRYYMPQDTMAAKERRDGGAQYTAWHREGLIVATPGDWCDYNYIRADMKSLAAKYQIQGIAIDRNYNGSHISQQLIEDGHNVQPIGQGNMTIPPAARELENLITSRKVEHFGNRILRWNVQNCVSKVVDDIGNVKPSKAKSTGRIDGIYAAIDAISLEMSQRAPTVAPGFFSF